MGVRGGMELGLYLGVGVFVYRAFVHTIRTILVVSAAVTLTAFLMRRGGQTLARFHLE